METAPSFSTVNSDEGNCSMRIVGSVALAALEDEHAGRRGSTRGMSAIRRTRIAAELIRCLLARVRPVLDIAGLYLYGRDRRLIPQGGPFGRYAPVRFRDEGRG